MLAAMFNSVLLKVAVIVLGIAVPYLVHVVTVALTSSFAEVEWGEVLCAV